MKYSKVMVLILALLAPQVSLAQTLEPGQSCVETFLRVRTRCCEGPRQGRADEDDVARFLLPQQRR